MSDSCTADGTVRPGGTTAAALLISGAAGYTRTERVLSEPVVYCADIGYTPPGILQTGHGYRATASVDCTLTMEA